MDCVSALFPLPPPPSPSKKLGRLCPLAPLFHHLCYHKQVQLQLGRVHNTVEIEGQRTLFPNDPMTTLLLTTQNSSLIYY